MASEDLNRNDLSHSDLNRNNPRPRGLGGGMVALIAGIAVMALLFMWAPWSGPTVANNTAPITSVQ